LSVCTLISTLGNMIAQNQNRFM